MANPEDIARLERTRWYEPTLDRYDAHLRACEHLGVEPEPLCMFAGEVLNTPEEKRDWLLKVEPIERVEPFMRFAQYQEPIAAEMTLGFSPKKGAK